jgi:dihydrofolate reductase
MKTSVFIASSLDGFIARSDGSIDWLPEPEPGSDEDYGYQAFIETVDALVMGRHTYETALAFDAWPYVLPVVVLSHHSITVPDRIPHPVERMEGTPPGIVQRLADQGAEHLYIDGGRTIQHFLAEGLIDRLIVTTVPVLIGDGIPLFGPLPRDVSLRLVASRSFTNGLVQSEYRVQEP